MEVTERNEVLLTCEAASYMRVRAVVRSRLCSQQQSGLRTPQAPVCTWRKQRNEWRHPQEAMRARISIAGAGLLTTGGGTLVNAALGRRAKHELFSCKFSCLSHSRSVGDVMMHAARGGVGRSVTQPRVERRCPKNAASLLG